MFCSQSGAIAFRALRWIKVARDRDG